MPASTLPKNTPNPAPNAHHWQPDFGASCCATCLAKAERRALLIEYRYLFAGPHARWLA